MSYFRPAGVSWKWLDNTRRPRNGDHVLPPTPSACTVRVRRMMLEEEKKSEREIVFSAMNHPRLKFACINIGHVCATDVLVLLRVGAK